MTAKLYHLVLWAEDMKKQILHCLKEYLSYKLDSFKT